MFERCTSSLSRSRLDAGTGAQTLKQTLKQTRWNRREFQSEFSQLHLEKLRYESFQCNQLLDAGKTNQPTNQRGWISHASEQHFFAGEKKQSKIVLCTRHRYEFHGFVKHSGPAYQVSARGCGPDTQTGRSDTGEGRALGAGQ